MRRHEATAALVVMLVLMAVLATQSAQTQTYTVLHNFVGGPDGETPVAGLIHDSVGNFYGTAEFGGPYGGGTVFKLDAVGNYTVLHAFTGGADGNYPQAVARDSAGNLYGTTASGGVYGCGTVFKLNTKTRKERVLYSFTGGADGGWPYAGVIRGLGGNFYGTASGGGAYDRGAVFKVDTDGNETVLYSFTGGADGAQLSERLSEDPDGNLYSTTFRGGDLACDAPYGCGTVFKVDTTGNETVLYSFIGGAGGGNPHAGLIGDPVGSLYGTTYNGGAHGMGAVFKVDTAGNETVLYSFTGGADGAQPVAGLIHDSTGNFYGTTYRGGDLTSCYGQGCGTVFDLDASGKYSVLHSFTGADGRWPYAGLIRDPAGDLYGTTSEGGAYDHGVVFKISFP
jgi:uncharacterized repeat protein (TIGR03803 family)